MNWYSTPASTARGAKSESAKRDSSTGGMNTSHWNSPYTRVKCTVSTTTPLLPDSASAKACAPPMTETRVTDAAKGAADSAAMAAGSDVATMTSSGMPSFLRGARSGHGNAPGSR